MSQRGFELDLNLCTGCQACAVACAIENELPWGSSWRWVETFNAQHLPDLPLHHLSLACNHCENAPCMQHCPALAYSKEVKTGAVLLDPDSCIGCKYCTWACPYDAPRYDARSGVVSKCTFCHHRQEEGLAPACVVQCPTGALQFGALEGLQGAEAVTGFPRTPAKPAIRFRELRDGAPPQFAPAFGMDELVAALPRRQEATTSLRSEWPLLVFSLMCAVLAGAMATQTGREFFHPLTFLAFAILAGFVSTFHLGRKSRAWRAVLNWKGSWVSRELLAFGAFTVCSILALGDWSSGSRLGPLAGVLGFVTLFAMDRVYHVTRMPELELHSARVLGTGVLVAGLVGGHPLVWGGAMTLKAILYLRRKRPRLRAGDPTEIRVSALRVGLGQLVPMVLLTLAPAWWAVPAWVLLAVGEAIDRAEFYRELRIPGPHSQIQEDEERALRGGAIGQRAVA